MMKRKYNVSCEYNCDGKAIDDIIFDYIIFKLQQLGENYGRNR